MSDAADGVMTRVLILGANGQLARNTIPFLLQRPDVAVTLYRRRPRRIKNPDPGRVMIAEADVLNGPTLCNAVGGQDESTPIDGAAGARIIDAMHA